MNKWDRPFQLKAIPNSFLAQKQDENQDCIYYYTEEVDDYPKCC